MWKTFLFFSSPNRRTNQTQQNKWKRNGKERKRRRTTCNRIESLLCNWENSCCARAQVASAHAAIWLSTCNLETVLDVCVSSTKAKMCFSLVAIFTFCHFFFLYFISNLTFCYCSIVNHRKGRNHHRRCENIERECDWNRKKRFIFGIAGKLIRYIIQTATEQMVQTRHTHTLAKRNGIAEDWIRKWCWMNGSSANEWTVKKKQKEKSHAMFPLHYVLCSIRASE